MERYQRQMALKELGQPGQQKLLAAKVLVIGAGGLGCPVLQYLAAAGVGTLGIVDFDVVSLSNLHRQVLYGMADIGKPKVKQAAIRLQEVNPDVAVHVYHERLTNQNALGLFSAYDVIVDTSDNFTTRYLVNDACVLMQKPLVYGAISRFEGQVAVFNYTTDGIERAVHYRDLFPVPPQEGEVANCAEAGVLGVLAGIIGGLQAAQAIKIITGIGRILAGRVQTYSLLTDEWFDWELKPAQEAMALMPADGAAFLEMDYDWQCGIKGFQEINVVAFNGLLSQNGIVALDVREDGELPAVTEFPHLRAPLSQLSEGLPPLESDIVLVFCQSGKRSRQAAQILAAAYPLKRLYSLEGGIINWKEHIQFAQDDRPKT